MVPHKGGSDRLACRRHADHPDHRPRGKAQIGEMHLAVMNLAHPGDRLRRKPADHAHVGLHEDESTGIQVDAEDVHRDPAARNRATHEDRAGGGVCLGKTLAEVRRGLLHLVRAGHPAATGVMRLEGDDGSWLDGKARLDIPIERVNDAVAGENCVARLLKWLAHPSSSTWRSRDCGTVIGVVAE